MPPEDFLQAVRTGFCRLARSCQYRRASSSTQGGTSSHARRASASARFPADRQGHARYVRGYLLDQGKNVFHQDGVP